MINYQKFNVNLEGYLYELCNYCNKRAIETFLLD